MKNGLNIGSVSELVHELRIKPIESQVRLGTKAIQLAPGLVSVEIATIQAGSVRAARDMRLGAGAHGDFAQPPSPEQYLLAGLAGCVMVTFIQGLSARGIAIKTFEIEVRGQARDDGQGPLADVGYDVMLDADVPDAMVEELAKFVSCFSPNHRTFVEPNEIDVQLVHPGGRSIALRPILEPARPSASLTPVSARFAWRYGTQLFGSTTLAGQAPIALRIDQPKQYLGLDSAPNPQEYVLAALTAELLRGAEQRLSERGFATGLSALTHGWLDMRGITNVDKTVPVRMHRLSTKLAVPAALDLEVAQEAAQHATRQWGAAATVCLPSAIHVTAHTPRGRVADFRSDLEFQRAYLQLIAEREEMAARAAAGG